MISLNGRVCELTQIAEKRSPGFPRVITLFTRGKIYLFYVLIIIAFNYSLKSHINPYCEEFIFTYATHACAGGCYDPSSGKKEKMTEGIRRGSERKENNGKKKKGIYRSIKRKREISKNNDRIDSEYTAKKR